MDDVWAISDCITAFEENLRIENEKAKSRRKTIES